MQESWLNPSYATDHLLILAIIILASLIVLPVFFGGMIYLFLGLIARFTGHRPPRDPESDEEA